MTTENVSNVLISNLKNKILTGNSPFGNAILIVLWSLASKKSQAWDCILHNSVQGTERIPQTTHDSVKSCKTNFSNKTVPPHLEDRSTCVLHRVQAHASTPQALHDCAKCRSMCNIHFATARNIHSYGSTCQAKHQARSNVTWVWNLLQIKGERHGSACGHQNTWGQGSNRAGGSETESGAKKQQVRESETEGCHSSDAALLLTCLAVQLRVCALAVSAWL